MRSRELPSASAAVKPNSRSAAGFQSTIRPSTSATMIASPAAWTRVCKSTWVSMLDALLRGLAFLCYRLPLRQRDRAAPELHDLPGIDVVLAHKVEPAV